MSLMPANPRMDLVKTVRIATTDGTNLKEPETLKSVANAENEANVDVVAAEGPEVVAVENEEAVVAVEVESVISIANPEMTRRKLSYKNFSRQNEMLFSQIVPKCCIYTNF